MSAIDFVVRGDAGVMERGSVAGATGDTTIIVGAGQEISLNLNRNNILSYVRQGQALQITLVDGQTITVEGYFSPEGAAENDLFISANGQLSKVDLVAGAGNLLFSQYIDADNFGKWSPDDELFFVQGSEVMVAGVEAAGAEAGMMFAPVLSKNEYQGRSIRQMSKALFDCAPGALVARLVYDEMLTDEMIEQIRSLLDDKQEKSNG